ncbi:MAG TPA: DUF4203 domain-containing protein [Microthrixaceae bacterium]|nr:DUF4203 domain-containing protein [Microthrixaceae bacterium]
MGNTVRMNEVVVGILAVAVGALFCFRGYLTMRIVIPIWGALVGFTVGAGLVAAVTGDNLLAGFASWITGAAIAVVFAALAYLYYEISVAVSMAGIGFMLGSSAMVALNVTWTWLIITVGVIVALMLGLVAVVGDLPMIILTILTATAGATAVVGGLMLLVGSVDTADLGRADVVDRIHDDPAWWLLYAFVAIAGIVSQSRAARSLEHSLREQWAADGGKQFRTS